MARTSAEFAERSEKTRLSAKWICLCCSRRSLSLAGYFRDGFLSLFHGPGYVGHQLLQIVLGGFKLRRLCVHNHLPIRRPPQGKGLAPQY